MAVNHPNLLFVDDNTSLHTVLKSVASTEQWKVYFASSGEEGLKVLSESPVDIILCDIMMPGMDGYEFYQKLRETATRAHIPCIFISGITCEDERKKGIELGVDEYLPKPFDVEDLKRVVRGKMRRSTELRLGMIEDQKNYRKKVIQTLSHELRTPLVSITTGAEVLLDKEEDNPKVKKVLEAIHRGGLRLEKLINDFLVLQHLEVGVAEKLVRERSEKVMVQSLIKDWYEDESRELQSLGFSVAVVWDAAGAESIIYTPFFLDALNRILSNAKKFSYEKKEIGIHVRETLDAIVIEIKDRGVGIDPTKCQEALDLFGQINRDKLEQQGGGLGLHISQRYLALHNAKISLQNRDGGGTVVTIELPRLVR